MKRNLIMLLTFDKINTKCETDSYRGIQRVYINRRPELEVLFGTELYQRYIERAFEELQNLLPLPELSPFPKRLESNQQFRLILIISNIRNRIRTSIDCS